MPHPVDIHVGERMRYYRYLAGLSQETLARQIGTTFQQMQKYETAANRVSASRLWQIAVALGRTPSDFYADLDQSDHKRRRTTKLPDGFLNDKEAINFIRTYSGIPEDKKSQFKGIVKAMAVDSRSTDGQ